MVTGRKQSSISLGILCVFCLCPLLSFTNAEDSFNSDDVEYDKRGFDRYSFVGKLGKRQEDEILTPKEQYETDIDDKREDENNESPVGDDNLLNAKRKIDRLMFTGALGKRSPYYRFAGTLGKRDDTSGESNTDNEADKRALDRMSYIGALGKRGQLDMRMFHGALGKRLDSMYYGHLGKRFSRYIGMLGKRSPLYKSFFGNLGKRVPYNKAFFGTLGKRGRIDNMYFGHLGKRDVSRSRRATNYGWFTGRPARAMRPIYTQTRGIDRFFSNVGLGKRAPDMRFLPTLGKRFFIPYEDAYYEDF